MFVNFLVETFALGLKNIRLHKLRSLLTTLGIVIGVSAVIIMVAIGEGQKRKAIEQLRQLGARNILVRSVPPPEGTSANGRTQRMLIYGLKDIDLERLKSLPGLAYLVPLRDTQQRVVFGDKLGTGVNAIGTTPDIFDVINLKAVRGRIFSQLEYERKTPVCVIGALAAQQLFPYKDPIGQRIQIGSVRSGILNLEIIGVLEQTGLRPGSGIINRVIDLDVYMPLTLAKATFGNNIFREVAGAHELKRIELTEIWLQTRTDEDVEPSAERAKHILNVEHPGPPDFEVKVPVELLRSAEATARMFNLIMGTIASLSLLVGGIGIMNIMLASVTERTREIGIRRALGAKRRHITLQFLIETTVVSLAGGMIGVGLGCASAWALPKLAPNYATSIAYWSVMGSFIVSGMIGIFFGLYPAVTAAKMDPIDALRHE